MIKQKLIEFFLWVKEHFHFLVEVVVRLSIGHEKQENPHTIDSEEVEERKR